MADYALDREIAERSQHLKRERQHSNNKKDQGDSEEQVLIDLYSWVDQIPITTKKRDIKRDFADGVMVAEIVKHYCPRFVELHNYAPANGIDKRMANWKLLNRKPFRKLGFEVTEDVILSIINGKQMAIENFLMVLRSKIDKYRYEQRRLKEQQEDGSEHDTRPEADQPYNAGSMTPASERYTPRSQLSFLGTSRASSFPGIKKNPSPRRAGPASQYSNPHGTYRAGEVVPKIKLEEMEQELLSKDETIQILQAKVRRLEHLLHLKDIRIDDLQTRMDRLESQLRPTGYQRR